jgi:hypothetical protein
MDNAMYLSSWSLIEPDDKFYFYQPTWLNAWEAHMYETGLKSTQANGWGLKRFGVEPDVYPPEQIRNPQYMPYLDAMEQATDVALQGLSTKERMKLLKSRTAFIYADSWGESGLFENISSALHISMIDTLPKNLLKKFAIKGPTCKIRGEKQAFVQALRVAQDYLSWDIFDNVVICVAFRAIPVLVFSEEEIATKRMRNNAHGAGDVNLTVERVGCFIFSQRECDIKVTCGEYVLAEIMDAPLINSPDLDIVAFNGHQPSLLNELAASNTKSLNLVAHYGASGCLTPALSVDYFTRHLQPGGKMRTVIPDNLFGYHYFDLEYREG